MRDNYIVQEKIPCARCKESGTIVSHDYKGKEYANLCVLCEGLGYTLKPVSLSQAIKFILWDENSDLPYIIYNSNKEQMKKRNENYSGIREENTN